MPPVTPGSIICDIITDEHSLNKSHVYGRYGRLEQRERCQRHFLPMVIEQITLLCT